MLRLVKKEFFLMTEHAFSPASNPTTKVSLPGDELYVEQWRISVLRILEEHPEYPFLASFITHLGDRRTWTTRRTYLLCTLRFLKSVTKPIDQLTLDDYLLFLSEQKQSPAQQLGAYHALKCFSHFLFLSHQNAQDHMALAERPVMYESIATIKKRRASVLNAKEISLLYQNIENGTGSDRARAYQAAWRERDLAILTLFLSTGLRASAICKLDVGNIDIEKGWLLTMEKGRKPRRKYLSQSTCSILKDWLRKREALLSDTNPSEQALFLSIRKTRLSYSGLFAIVKKYGESIENKSIHPHSLRATYATCLYKETRDLYYVQKMMGHAQPGTTELYIREMDEDADQKAAEIMDGYVKRG